MDRPLARHLGALALALALVVGCEKKPGVELGEAACSNGIDDDGDGLVDCADPTCRLFSFCLSEADAGHAADAGDASLACGDTADLVIVLDVSSSMTATIGQLAELAPSIFDAVRAERSDAHVSLVVFVDDALAVDGCAPLADAAALRSRLDAYRAFSASNRSPVSELPNLDCAENSLDALNVAISSCPWRAGLRAILHVTDDTFVERPAVLSGPYGPGVVVASTYAEVSAALARLEIHLLALTASGPGVSCGGPQVSPDVGRGFTSPFGDAPSLPERTGGRAWPLAGLRDGSFALAPALTEVFSRASCAP